MGMPVVKSANGYGLPVSFVDQGGLPVEEAANGFGTPIIEVATGGLPVTRVGDAAAPASFTSGQWSAVDATTGGALTVTISALPSDGGSPITSIQYQVGAGAWTASGISAPGSFSITGLTNGVAVDVKVRAVNSVGAGSASDTKTRTPTLVSMTFTDDFNRANENLEASPSWAKVSGATAGALQVVNNGLVATTTVENMYLSPDKGFTKQLAKYKNNGNGSAGPFVCLRAADMNNWIGIRSSTTAYQVWKRVAGALTQLSALTPAGVPAVSDILLLRDDGVNVSLELNGSVIGTVAVTDVPASTRQGINARSQARTPAWIDDYEAGGYV